MEKVDEAGEIERGMRRGDVLVGDRSGGDELRDLLDVRRSRWKKLLGDVEAGDLVLFLLWSIIVRGRVCPRMLQMVEVI